MCRNTCVISKGYFLTKVLYPLLQSLLSQPCTKMCLINLDEHLKKIKWNMQLRNFSTLNPCYYSIIPILKIHVALPVFMKCGAGQHKLPCFCPISVGNHTVSDETQTHTPIEKITPQKVAKNFYTPLREKGNQNRDL